MSDTSSSDAKKPSEQTNDDQTEAMGQLPLNTDDSDETSPSPKNLSDMPIDVVGLIIERSDYRQQLKLRKVSKSFRALVDQQKPACKSIQVEYWDESVVIILNEHHVMYSKDGKYIKDEDIAVKRDDFEKAALEDLASTLKNPRLQLEEFSVIENSLEKYYDRFRDLLKSLNHQLSVKRVLLDVLNPLDRSILPYLKPFELKTIFLCCDLLDDDWSSSSTEMDQVVLLEQWKQAEELELEYCFGDFPVEYATHFKQLLIKKERMDDNEFARILEFLSKLDNFEHCTLISYEFDSDPDFVYELLGAPVSSSTTEEIFHHPIPDSDFYFEFKKAKDSDYVEIEKKKKRLEN